MIRALMIACLATAATGCGQVVKEVKGQVFLDGQPAEKLVLVFWHVGHMHEPFGGGVTDEEGYYEIVPHDQGIRWWTGEFAVQVADPPVLAAQRKRQQPSLAPVYQSSKTTPLRAVIDSGKNELPSLYLESGEPIPLSPALLSVLKNGR